VNHKLAEKIILMLKFPLQFFFLHSANYWFGFNGFNGTYRNYGNCLLLVTLDTIRAAYALANCYTGSFTPIDIYDLLH